MNRPCLLFFALCLWPVGVFAYNVEDYEEPGGMSFSVQGNGQQGVYGLAFEDGTWLADTPVLGQFFLNAVRHDPLDATFGGVGMIFRIMPHWQVAPYAGGGASYNNLFHEKSNEARDTSDTTSKVESHWAWHAEGGLRLWLPGNIHFFEFFGRQTWTTIDNRYNYWTAGFGYGQNF